MKITGDTLISWGFKPGKWFKEAIEAADVLARENHFNGANHTEFDMIEVVKQFEPAPIEIYPPQKPADVAIHYNIEAHTDFEIDNLEKVRRNIAEIAQVPVVRAISVMPDACPQGGGGIPVGAVAITENAIIPGFHSADICCSVAMTVFPSDTDPTAILDAGMKISHFGKGGRPYSHDMQVSQDLLNEFESNPYLTNKSGAAEKNFGTQGDGNHFFYVGRIESTGQIALVTHHGSRKPGAMLYNVGVDLAERMTGQHAPYLHKHNLWIPYDTQEGQDYWEALQIIRRWTKGNHFTIHNAIAKAVGAKDKDRYWNEHNFVFKREYGGKTYFAHAKGATPAYMGFAPDMVGKTLIPLNMAQPILIAEVNQDVDHGMDFLNQPSLGFSPHGAGRNYSRTDFGKMLVAKGISAKQMIADITAQYDVRAFSGKHDISEFPEAYKNADQIVEQIDKFGLTKVVDKIQPIGCIMAGHDGTDYRAIKRAKKERRMREADEQAQEN
jgi:RNA-splicing ligase RtcB